MSKEKSADTPSNPYQSSTPPDGSPQTGTREDRTNPANPDGPATNAPVVDPGTTPEAVEEDDEQ